MKKFLMFLVLVLTIATFLISCARSVTVQQAASGNYKRCKAVR